MRKLDAYRAYLLLEGAQALFFSLVFTINMVYQVTIVELSPLQLVLVGTTLEAAVFLFEIPTGVVADVFSRRLSIIIGMFLIGAGFILEGSIPVFAAVLACQVLWGLGYTFTSGATQAWISDEIGEAAAGKAFLRASQVARMTSLLGMGVSVVLASLRINIPILAGGFCFLALGIFLSLRMPETGFAPTARLERNTWQSMRRTFYEGLTMVRRRPALLTILGIGLFYGLYSEVYDRLWTKHLLDSFALPDLDPLQPVVWFGIINVVGILLSLGAAELVHRRLNTQSHRDVAWALVGFTTALIVALLSFTFAGSFTLALAAIWVVQVARSLIDPVYTTWVNQELDSRVRATVISMSGQVDAIGQIAGGPALGVVAEVASVRAALALSGVVLSPVLALFAHTLRKIPGEAGEADEAVAD